MPLAVHHPVFYKQTTKIQLPAHRGWPARSGTIADQAVRFDYRYSVSDRVIALDYSFRTLDDNIPADRVAKHLDTLEQIRKAMWFQVDQSARAAPAVAISAVVIVIVVFGIPAVVIVTVVVRSRVSRRQVTGFRDVPRRPGDSPETAIEIGEGVPLSSHLQSLRCACGAALFDPASPPHQEGFAFDGRRLIAVRLNCGSCSRQRDLYFRWAT